MEDKLFTGYSHVGIYVTDLEEAIRFYKEVLDFDLLFQLVNESDGLKIAMLQLGNCSIELLEPPTDREVLLPKEKIVEGASATINHVAILVTDIKKAFEHVRSFGYEFEERGIYFVPNFGSDRLDLNVAFFRGPNGERIELFQRIEK
ncbi:MAG: VOC family protein [Clostridiales bacterium]|nr:VOC family protein [Clostridiales bacterium]